MPPSLRRAVRTAVCGVLVVTLAAGCRSGGGAPGTTTGTVGEPSPTAVATSVRAATEQQSTAATPPVHSGATTAASSPPASPQPSVGSRPPTSRITTVVTSTASGATQVVGPPPATVEPAAVAGTCPYLSADLVSDITGQHHGTTAIVTVAPLPICVFTRSDGRPLAQVRFIAAASPAAAVAAVNQHVPVADSQPASQPTGWTGGSKTVGQKVADCTDCHSWYAVSKGSTAVVVEEYETPSLKARTIAICSIFGAGLAQGSAPDYCSAG